jgi:hypothetical protein
MGLAAACKACAAEYHVQRSTKVQATVLSAPHEGSLVCTKCTKTLPTSDFPRRRSSLTGYNTRCKPCRIEVHNAYTDTLMGRLKALCIAAEKSNALRISRGRVFAPVEAVPTILKMLYDQQQGKCIISFVELSSIAHSNWLMSLERLDNSLGYIKGNMALIAGEFNTGSQLTKEKARFAFNPLNQSWQSESERVNGLARLAVELGRVGPGEYDLTTSPPPSHFAHSKLPICRHCGIQDPPGGFLERKGRICRSCMDNYMNARSHTVLGFVRRLLGSAKNNTKRRNATRNTSEKVDLTVERILDMIWDQGCRCYISGLLMSLRPGTEWQASLERLDTSKGYTKDNVKIICWEFNSTVRICAREEAPTGSGQLTPIKFAYATKCHQAEMARINQVSQDHIVTPE